jgi:hypothetical protein
MNLAEELLSAKRAFTYADLYAMLETGETVAWLTPHAVVVRAGGEGAYAWGQQVTGSHHLFFSADGKEISAFARSHEHLLEICDVVLRLLTAGVVHSVILQQRSSRDGGVLINVGSLAYLMEQCQSLKVLLLQHLEMDENHCQIDYYVLANGLRGNSRLESLTPLNPSNRELTAIAGALRENKGLVHLSLGYSLLSKLSDETCNAVCDSLKTHPTLQILNLMCAYVAPLAPSLLESRIQALVDIMKGNLSIHTIRVQNYYREHELFRGSVIPYLETNRLRPRLLAIQKTRPVAYRTMVLGRALLAVRTDPNRFWMLLSGNPEVAFPSTTATIAAAASLPTLTATSTANVAAVAASVCRL